MKARDWLRENDPQYVSPQAKAARTRAIPVDPRRLGELLSGQTTRKVGGVWRSMTPIGFAGSEEDLRLEVVDATANPERDAVLEQMGVGKTKRGKRGGRSKNERKREKSRRARADRFRG